MKKFIEHSEGRYFAKCSDKDKLEFINYLKLTEKHLTVSRASVYLSELYENCNGSTYNKIFRLASEIDAKDGKLGVLSLLRTKIEKRQSDAQTWPYTWGGDYIKLDFNLDSDLKLKVYESLSARRDADFAEFFRRKGATVADYINSGGRWAGIKHLVIEDLVSIMDKREKALLSL